MSRKTPHFRKLIAYMEKDGNPLAMGHNLRTTDLKNTRNVANEFLKNYQYCPQRKNGNALYHEILAFSAKDSPHLTDQILEDLTTRYLAKRAPNALAYARIHQDKDHIHIHCMISGNLIESPQKLRLSTTEFETVKQEIEAYQKATYPFLKHSLCQDKNPERSISVKEGEISRQGKISQKEKLIQIFTKALACMNETDFFQVLNDHDLELYQRGKNHGLYDPHTKKKYRLKTLGLQEAFLSSPERWQTLQKRTQEIEQIKATKKSRQLQKAKHI